MAHRKLLLNGFFIALLLPAFSACGGGGDDGPVPTGEPIADIRLVDSDSYNALDKLRADGSFFKEGDTDYGTRNPNHRKGDGTTSAWAVDTSAVAPNGEEITYSMVINTKAGAAALNSMKNNLQINAATGLITQTCSGFPVCYDNDTAADQHFEITAIAQVVGSKRKLQRKFTLTVIHNG